MMRALVIGGGSIGMRHARVLSDIGFQVAVVSSRSIAFPKVYRSIKEALSDFSPFYVVIAGKTSDHYSAVMELDSLSYKGKVLIEKPLFSKVHPIGNTVFANASVGYNLRFHPMVLKIKEEILGEKILSVNVYVGQYLPDWRPNRDYRSTYSSYKEEGGGVLMDLSHELDLVLKLFGGWISVIGNGGHVSNLQIQADDLYCILLKSKGCSSINIQMSYLDKIARRHLIINTNNKTITADLISGDFFVNGELTHYSVDRDYTYSEMHKLVQSGKQDLLCSIAEGLEVLSLIESIEKSQKNKIWIDN